MDTAPPEIIHKILLELSADGLYDEICLMRQVNIVLCDLIHAWQNELFTGLRTVAWRFTKTRYLNKFNQALVAHYGCEPAAISNINTNNIPNLRNNLAYSANIAVERFLNLSTIWRQLLMQAPYIGGSSINDYIVELQTLSRLTAVFMKFILDYKVRLIEESLGHKILSVNNTMIDQIQVPINIVRSEYVLFFQLLNRLNTLICHVCKILNYDQTLLKHD